MLEKVLKARVVLKMGAHPPYTHNLSRLVQLANVKLSQEETSLLAQVNEFNLQTRYPDDRLEFYKFATKKYADHYYAPIQKLYHRLCQSTP